MVYWLDKKQVKENNVPCVESFKQDFKMKRIILFLNLFRITRNQTKTLGMDFQSFKLTFVKMNSLTDRRLDQPMDGRTKWLVELRNTRLKTSSPFRHAINGAEKYFFLLFFLIPFPSYVLQSSDWFGNWL